MWFDSHLTWRVDIMRRDNTLQMAGRQRTGGDMRGRRRCDERANQRRRAATAAVALALCLAPSLGWANSDRFDSALLPPPPASALQAPSHGSIQPHKTEKRQFDSAAPVPDAPPRTARDWLMEKRDILGDAPDMVRYVANECILAGVAGAAIAVALTVSGGAVGPVATAALGVAPEMSPLGITALGCVAGAAAGVASAVAIYAYEEPETVREFAVAQAANIQYAATTVAGAVAGAVQAPQDAVYAAAAGAWQVAAAAASGVGYVASAAAGGAQAGAGVVMAAATGVGSWWYGAPAPDAPELAFDVADAVGGGLARVY